MATTTTVGRGGGYGVALSAPEPHLDEGGEAVSGARSVGDDGVSGLVLISIDSHHVCGHIAALGGGGDQHLLGTSLQPSPHPAFTTPASPLATATCSKRRF